MQAERTVHGKAFMVDKTRKQNGLSTEMLFRWTKRNFAASESLANKRRGRIPKGIRPLLL